ncbi:hypothetical protein [Pedobacter sp. UC225_65]|uniref:hypothetical protein n=1 Tax=Pedobacter sp. UC225_65 TaxID=3350173 RepID=UPI00366ED693
MRYYIINNTLDLKIAGKYPQVQDAHYYCSIFDEPRFIDHLNFQETINDPIVAHAILSQRANPTDLLSADIAGFHLRLLISGKLKAVFESTRQPKMQFYNTPVIWGNDILKDYWVLNMFGLDFGNVDIQKSEVVLRKRKPEGGTYLSSLSFDTTKEFLNMIEEDQLEGKLYMQTTVFRENTNDDLIVLKYVDGGAKYYVSEKLKTSIEEIGCTGLEFQPSEISFNEWLKKDGQREKIYGKV